MEQFDRRMSEINGGNSPRKRLGRIKKTLVFLAINVGIQESHSHQKDSQKFAGEVSREIHRTTSTEG